jgi:hypothetical protein
LYSNYTKNTDGFNKRRWKKYLIQQNDVLLMRIGSQIRSERKNLMKKLLIFNLVMVLLLVSISPALAGNGDGGGGGRGNGHGRNGNTNNQQKLGAGGSGYGWRGFNVITGVITAKSGSAESGLITLPVYGGKDTSLYGTIYEVKTNSSTRFLSKDDGEITEITFDDVAVGDAASIAIGSDGFADRITVGVECSCIP